MTWALVGLLFGFGFMVAAMLAVSAPWCWWPVCRPLEAKRRNGW